jgi:signal transduction histidine kinase
LQAVLMTTHLLLESDVDREKQTAALQRIQRSTRRMSGMIEDLMDFTRTRIGSGLSVSPVASDLGQIARDAVDEARGAFPARRFELRVEGDVFGQVDVERMKQVFANLLSNAADYGDPSSAVRVEVSGTDAAIRIAVINSGDLIPAHEIAVIFDPFKRLQQDGDDAPGSQHLGLGLYIAAQLVQAHGGRIDVTSSAADGTRFTVLLPRQELLGSGPVRL